MAQRLGTLGVAARVTDALLAEALGAEAYERVRAAYLPLMIERRRRRRLRLGENITLLFENRETVLAQLHEKLRAAGRWDEAYARREESELAALLPAPGELTATLMIDGGPVSEDRRLSAWLRSRIPVLLLDVGGRDDGGGAGGQRPRPHVSDPLLALLRRR